MGRLPNPDSTYGKVNAILDENPRLDATEVARRLDLPRAKVASYVSRYHNRRAREAGRMAARKIAVRERVKQDTLTIIRAATERNATPTPAAAPAPPPPTEEDIERIKAAIKDPDKRVDMLAEIGARARDETAIRAILEIHALQTQAGLVSTLPPPTSPDEQIARLAVQLEAAGRESAQRAWDAAFAPKAAPTEAEATEELPPEAAMVP